MTKTLWFLFAATSAVAVPQAAFAQTAPTAPVISQEDSDCFVAKTCDFEVRGSLTKAEQEDVCMTTGTCPIGDEKLVVLVKPRAAKPMAQLSSQPQAASLTRPAARPISAAPRANAVGQARVIPKNCTPSAPDAMNMCLSFALGSSDLTPSARNQIGVFANSLKKSPDSGKFQIEGHTDSSGTSEQNADLSRRRAESVVSYLVSLGVPAARLAAEGYGFSKPKPGLQSSDPLNRRVEIVRK